MEKEMVDVMKTTAVDFGHQGENLAKEIVFDITSLKKEFPDAVYSLVILRPGETEPCLVSQTTVTGNEFRYQPTSWATGLNGVGQWEIHALDANTNLIAKTIVGSFIVSEALPDEDISGAPEAVGNWIQQLNDAATRAEQAAEEAERIATIDVTNLQKEIITKIDKPETEGTNGQILMSNGEGGQTWQDPPETYTLPAATTRKLGGIIIGDGLEVDSDGRLMASTNTLATETRDGLIRAIDQKKLNTIEEGANRYILPAAMSDSLGGIKVGNNLQIRDDGKLDVVIPEATTDTLGGVKVGSNLQADDDGTLNVVIPEATADAIGGIKIGRNLTVDQNGRLNAVDSYELPTATGSRLGGIKVGSGLSVAADGTLEADVQAITPATETDLGGIKIGNNLQIDETGITSAYSYDITKTSNDNGKTYQLNLIRSDGNAEEIVQSIDLPAGGSGSSSVVSNGYLNIERVTTSPIITISNSKVLITVDIQSREGSSTTAPFVDGTYVWKNGTTILSGMSGAYSQVRNTFDLTPFVSHGTQRLSLTVTQSDSHLTQTKTWNIQIVDIRLESAFFDEYTNVAGQNINFTYIPYGAVEKTVHFKMDGVELPSRTLSASQSGSKLSYTLSAKEHGTHLLEAWIEATIGSNSVKSDSIFEDVIWYDRSSSTPIVGCSQRTIPVSNTETFDKDLTYYTKDEEGLYHISNVTTETWNDRGQLYYLDNKATQYSSTTIVYNVYDPASPNPTVFLYEDNELVGTRIIDEPTNNVWVYKTKTAGVHTLKIACGETSVDIIVNITALEVEINPVMDNLVFDFNPEGYNNTDENRLWSYTNAENEMYSMTVSEGFDWVNGGYKQDDDGNVYFMVKSGCRATINCGMFSRTSESMKRYGQHFKVIFQVENVRDVDATWLYCMGQTGESEIGLKMNAQEACFYSGIAASSNNSNPKSLHSDYSENDRIEYEYDIQPLSITDNTATSYIMSYEDGTMYRPIIYDSSNILQQKPASDIIIGSDDCDIRIYRMKLYDASLTNEEIMSNFIADAPSGEEIYSRYIRNQIYDPSADGALTPEYLASKCPDLRIIKISAPHFTNKKSNVVGDTTVQCIYKNGDPVLDNWTVTNAAHSGQGTTSDNYGISGRNIDLRLKTDEDVGANPVVTFGDGTQSDPGKVKISLTRDSVATNYFNIKLNIASSENANNALLAKRYDRYLPYETPAHKRNSKVKTTMEFYNCVVFIQETGDLSIHEEFADTNWHFYGIGNIGDSKKTDKERVYTPDDPKEFVNEIQDNTLANSRFDTGVYNLIVDNPPSVGDNFIDYYINNSDGTYTLQRYLEGAWSIVKENVSEITNGAVAVSYSLPITGVAGIEYFIHEGNGYNMYIWRNNSWSTPASQTASDFEDAKRRHMATAIDPRQWCAGNEKYDAMKAGWSGKKTWEMRYEAAEKVLDDETEIAAQHAQNVSIWEQMYTWMVTSTDEEFVSEFENWFYKDAALYAYLFTEQYTMMDNRAKNTFWHWAKFYVTYAEAEELGDENYYIPDDAAAAINDGYRFDFWDYDNDSALGIDNTGAMGLSYGKEDIDKIVEGDPTSKNVYNAADSVLWRRIRLLMHDDLRSMYQRLENTGCWATNGFIEEFDAWQSQWPEELWTKDMERKYIRPYFGTSYDNSTTVSADGKTVKKSSQYLEDMLNGRKKYQRRQWIRNQSVYMGTKYLSASIANDNIMLRCYEPSGAAVSPDYTLRIVPYINMYLSVMFGSSNNLVQVRAKAGIEYELPCPISMSGATDIPFYIYAASNIQELSDLSACYFTTNNFAGATRLKKLKIGNSTEGYSNQLEILNLGTGEHDLLEILDITNCTNLIGTTSGGTLNLSGCRRLSQLYAKGTSISSVVFAVNGALETAVLPDSLTGLTMIGLDKITNFEANYDSLTSLTLEASAVDDRAIIEDAYDTIRNLRLVDVNWTDDNQVLYNTDILNALSDMSKMYDSYISGVIHINGSAAQREIAHYNEVWPYLTVVPAAFTPEYKVTYVNADETVLGYEYIVAGKRITDPIGRTVSTMHVDGYEVSITMAEPTLSDTEQYSYTFSGWDTLDGAITRDRKVVAKYNANVRTYTVNWYQKVNGIKLATGQYAYGEEAVYDYTPTTDVVFDDTKTYYYKPNAAYIIWSGEWENRPTLYEHNDIPKDITGESQEIYRLFTGWDRSTGHVVPDFTHADGHVDVYAVWSECSELPAIGTAMRNMTPVQIYGITRQPAAIIKQYFSVDGPDYTAVTLGHNPEFSNVDSVTPIESKTWFDGATGIISDNGSGESIKLLAEDAPSFTMAIDFDMRDAGSGDADHTLVACYDEDGRKGFRLSCGYRSSDGKYGPTIQWGTQTFDVGYSQDYADGAYYKDVRYRDMVVIRHIQGDSNLYVYTSNDGVYFSSNIIRYTKETVSSMVTDTPLVFGGFYHLYDNEFDSSRYGTGYIYWCKIWFDDLGEYTCRRIASWPRETLHLQYYGTQRYYLADGGMTAASFISYRPLYGRSIYSTSNYSQGSLWSNSPARQFLSNRLVDTFPFEWQSMMQNVKINTIISSNDGTTTEETYDKIYLPAYADVYPIVVAPRSLEQFSSRSGEGTMITWFANSMARVKSKVLDISINANYWTGSSDPRIQVDTNVKVGDLWSISINSSSAVYVFVDRNTIERDHLQIRSNTVLDDDGGWVQISSYWILRTPDSTNTQNGYQYQFSTVSATGVISRYSYNLYSEYGEGVSITPCFSI